MIIVGDDLCDVVDVTLDPRPKVNGASVDVHVKEELVIPAKSFETIDALEYFDMLNELTAHLTGRSAHMRQGIYMPGGYVDPGYEGSLKLEFFNMSNESVRIEEGEAAARLTFYKLQDAVESYDGRWSE